MKTLRENIVSFIAAVSFHEPSAAGETASVPEFQSLCTLLKADDSQSLIKIFVDRALSCIHSLVQLIRASAVKASIESGRPLLSSSIL